MVSQNALWSMRPSGPTECTRAGAKGGPTASSPWHRVQFTSNLFHPWYTTALTCDGPLSFLALGITPVAAWFAGAGSGCPEAACDVAGAAAGFAGAAGGGGESFVAALLTAAREPPHWGVAAAATTAEPATHAMTATRRSRS